MTPEQASDFYAEHYGKMFFPSLIAYMSRYMLCVLTIDCYYPVKWASIGACSSEDWRGEPVETDSGS